MGRDRPLGEVMKIFLVLAVALAFVDAGQTKQRIKRTLQSWNHDVACWGKDNALNYHFSLYKAMEQCGKGNNLESLLRASNPFTKPFGRNPWVRINKWSNLINDRSKRQAGGLLEYNEEEEIEKFKEDFVDFKSGMRTKLGNVTCVLTKMGMLDSSLQVNLEFYTHGIWERTDLSKTLAGDDPVWRQHVVQGMNDCFQIAQNWPEESLNENPLHKVFGRHMLFFKCASKVQNKMCAAAQMNEMISTLYGDGDDYFNWAQLGMPKDKYERAAQIFMVTMDQASDEEKFVDDFMNLDMM